MKTTPQSGMLKYIRQGYYCEITCSGSVWNIGLRIKPHGQHNDFTGWGKSFKGAVASLNQAIKRKGAV